MAIEEEVAAIVIDSIAGPSMELDTVDFTLRLQVYLEPEDGRLLKLRLQVCPELEGGCVRVVQTDRVAW